MEQHNLSENQVAEFLINPVWLQIKRDLENAIEDGLNRLEKSEPSDGYTIANIQGSLERLREMVKLPEGYLEELKQDEELKENAN